MVIFFWFCDFLTVETALVLVAAAEDRKWVVIIENVSPRGSRATTTTTTMLRRSVRTVRVFLCPFGVERWGKKTVLVLYLDGGMAWGRGPADYFEFGGVIIIQSSGFILSKKWL